MGTPPQVSHAVEHLGDRLLIVCLSGKGATVDSTRVLCLRSRGGHIVPTLGVDLGDVGVGSGFVHVAIIGLVGTDRGSRWTVSELG